MNKIFKYISIFFIVCCSSLAFAQPGDPGGNPDDEPVPITGIEILLAAGGLFGAKKVFDNSKGKKVK